MVKENLSCSRRSFVNSPPASSASGARVCDASMFNDKRSNYKRYLIVLSDPDLDLMKDRKLTEVTTKARSFDLEVPSR